MSNNVKVMDAVRNGRGNASKKDVHSVTALSWGTMCKVTNNLLDLGFIFARKEKAKAPGRPVVPLCVNAESAYFCGMDVGAAYTRVVFCNMNFNIIYRCEVETERYSSPERFTAWLTGVFETAASDSGIDRSKLHSAGIAVSGNVDSENSIIVSGGNFGMKFGSDVSLEEFSRNTGCRVYAVTTQAAAVCAEYHFGKCAGLGNLVTIGLGVGIGSGIVANHHLLISHPKRPVGYIGHILIPGNGHVCSCGFKGCLEAYSGAEFLVQVAKEKLPGRPELHSAAALDRAAAAGDCDAAAIMDTAASYNAIGIASMIQLYAPDALIFSGGQSRANGYLFNKSIEKLKEILPPERRSCNVGITNLGQYQSALGAVRLAYEKFF